KSLSSINSTALPFSSSSEINKNLIFSLSDVFSYSVSIVGISATQGGHQDAQTFTNRTFPLYFSKWSCSPLDDSNGKLKAACVSIGPSTVSTVGVSALKSPVQSNARCKVPITSVCSPVKYRTPTTAAIPPHSRSVRFKLLFFGSFFFLFIVNLFLSLNYLDLYQSFKVTYPEYRR